jgi:hypothetical protein
MSAIRVALLKGRVLMHDVKCRPATVCGSGHSYRPPAVERNPIKGGSECEENGGIKHEERFLGPEREESG